MRRLAGPGRELRPEHFSVGTIENFLLHERTDGEQGRKRCMLGQDKQRRLATAQGKDRVHGDCGSAAGPSRPTQSKQRRTIELHRAPRLQMTPPRVRMEARLAPPPMVTLLLPSCLTMASLLVEAAGGSERRWAGGQLGPTPEDENRWVFDRAGRWPLFLAASQAKRNHGRPLARFDRQPVRKVV